MNESLRTDSETTANANDFAGLAVTALVVLMYEILLTRIFSVTLWYHFAFMAISIAMFGMTAGAMFIYFFRSEFTSEKVHLRLTQFSIALSISMVIAALSFAFAPMIAGGWSIEHAWLASVAISYPLLTIPFFFGGVVVSLALTKFPTQISKLYCADLIGAAVGCILIIGILSVIDGLSAILVLGAIAGFGAYLFSSKPHTPKLQTLAIVLCTAFLGLAMGNVILARDNKPALALHYVKGHRELPGFYEKWNSYSRILVSGDMNASKRPEGWGLSEKLPTTQLARQVWLLIDGSAATVITNYTQRPEDIEHLKYDVTNVAHHVRPESDVLVIGVGGGRDVLSALAFKQKSVTGIEINQNILDALKNVFGNFAGHLENIPGVILVNDEARSYVARTDKKFDIIQVSLIDTWAATQAGALALTENSLYTKEAWKLFLDHLTDRGVVSFSRWYGKKVPSEIYRLVSLASTVLQEAGVKNPRQHLMIVRMVPTQAPDRAIATLLMTKSPITEIDAKRMADVCAQMAFEVLLDPRIGNDQILNGLATGNHSAAAQLDLDLSPPTDDRPFFFQMAKPEHAFRNFSEKLFDAKTWVGGVGLELKALFVVIAIVTALNALCIFLPLSMKAKEISLRQSGSLLVYFLCIGLAFMLIEIAQMQRLSLFLGNPVLGLSVILFSLLVSGGLGSLATEKAKTSISRLILLIAITSATGVVTPWITTSFAGAQTIARAVLAVAMVFPMGFFMGMAFPLGLKLAVARNQENALPWLWGINGSASVFASIFSILISFSAGISATFWCGVLCYAIATAAYIKATTAHNKLALEPSLRSRS